MNYRYQNILVTKNKVGERLYTNNIYPDIPMSEDDSYIICTLEDRLDLIALDFYGDSSFWWVVASANALPGDSLYPEPGMQLRIPADLPGVLNNYKLINTIR